MNRLDETIAVLETFLEAARRTRKRRKLANLETALTPIIGAAFQAQGRAFLARLTHLRGQFAEAVREPEWGPLWDETASATEELFAKIAQEIEAAMDLGIEAGYEDIDFDGAQVGAVQFGLDNPRAVAYLRERGANLVSGLNAETRNRLRTLLTQAADEGWTYNETADAIQAMFDGFAEPSPLHHIETRAHLVAVTELGNAYSYGNHQVGQTLQDAGLAMEKSWLTAGAVDECADNEAAGWIPFDEPYPSGVDHPLDHPGCRCDELIRRAGSDED